jgi:hypothetical protein
MIGFPDRSNDCNSGKTIATELNLPAAAAMVNFTLF